MMDAREAVMSAELEVELGPSGLVLMALRWSSTGECSRDRVDMLGLTTLLGSSCASCVGGGGGGVDQPVVPLGFSSGDLNCDCAECDSSPLPCSDERFSELRAAEEMWVCVKSEEEVVDCASVLSADVLAVGSSAVEAEVGVVSGVGACEAATAATREERRFKFESSSFAAEDVVCRASDCEARTLPSEAGGWEVELEGCVTAVGWLCRGF